MSNDFTILTQSEHLSTAAFKAYLENKLNKDACRQFEEHLSSCDLCSDAFDGFASLNSAEQMQLEQIQNPYQSGLKAQLNRKWYQQSWAIAASFIIIIGGFAFIISKYRSNENSKELAKLEKTTPSQLSEETSTEVRPDTPTPVHNESIKIHTDTVAKNSLQQVGTSQSQHSGHAAEQVAAPPPAFTENDRSDDGSQQLDAGSGQNEESKFEEAPKATESISRTKANINPKPSANLEKESKKKRDVLPASAAENNLSNYNNNQNYVSDKQATISAVEIRQKDALEKYDVKESVNKGIQLYNEGKYKRCIRYFEQQLSKSNDKSLNYYYIGLCYLKPENYNKEKASTSLNKAVEAGGAFQQAAKQILSSLN